MSYTARRSIAAARGRALKPRGVARAGNTRSPATAGLKTNRYGRAGTRNKQNDRMDRKRMRETDKGGAILVDRRGAVKWLPQNAMTVDLLEQLIDERRIDQCVALQQADGWFIVLATLPRERGVRHLATFRALGRPRRFSRLDVLFRLLHETLGYNGAIQVLPYTPASASKRLGAR